MLRKFIAPSIRCNPIDGDEVVLGCVRETKLNHSGKYTGAGHFCADGTWHEGANH
ncbi:MAG: hypothetical protein IT461_05950 [Planctomycetes bacterium]|jgi:hypothetical protein|nr:hypothetical protein [Planctomycetota bacterium]